jgi:hypothetical protein
MCEGGHPEPSGQGPSSETRGERGEDLSEFDSPGQIRVPPSTWSEPFSRPHSNNHRKRGLRCGGNHFQFRNSPALIEGEGGVVRGPPAAPSV